MSHASEPVAVQLLQIDEGRAGQRLDNYLITVLKGAPRALVYRIVRRGEVRVNKGRVSPDYRLVAGDVVRVPPVRLSEVAPTPQPRPGLQRELARRIIYDDQHLLAIDKPAGLAVHGGSGVALGLVEALRALRPATAAPLELVHRLDRDTSGLILLTAHRPLLRALHQRWRDNEVDKRYVALLSGRLSGQHHRVEAPLLKVERPDGEAVVRVSRTGKPAITEFTVLQRFPQATLVEAKLITGRTHQIRVHAQHLGHPLVGDDKYGQSAVNAQFAQKGLKRLYLHARQLRLTMPSGEVLTLVSEPDADFQRDLEVLKRG